MVAGVAIPLGAILTLFLLQAAVARHCRIVRRGPRATLIANAAARQIVQSRSLEVWAKLDKLPVRGDWDSFLLFVIILLVLLVSLGWLARVACRAARLKIEHKSAEV